MIAQHQVQTREIDDMLPQPFKALGVDDPVLASMLPPEALAASVKT